MIYEELCVCPEVIVSLGSPMVGFVNHRGRWSRGLSPAEFADGAISWTYPIPLETVLRTEEAIFYAQL